jgi:hypothetical protein
MRVGGQRRAPAALFRDPVSNLQDAGWADSSMMENCQQYTAPLEFPPLIHRQHLKVLKTSYTVYIKYLYESRIWHLLQLSLTPNFYIYYINLLQIIDSL